MIRLREFNMAELEYFIDPDVEAQHDFERHMKIQAEKHEMRTDAMMETTTHRGKPIKVSWS